MKKIYRIFTIFFLSLLTLYFCRGAMRLFFSEAIFPFERAGELVRRQIGERMASAWHGFCYGTRDDTLTLEIDRLRLEISELDRIRQENSDLRERLSLVERSGGNLVLAPIFSHGGGLGAWPRLKLGKGLLDGVKENDVVLVPEGVIGRIDEVSLHTSRVQLLSDPEIRVAVSIAGVESETRGILRGRGGHKAGGSAAILYSADTAVAQWAGRMMPSDGAVLITNGSGGIFPHGLTVGWITGSAFDERGLYREAGVTLAVDVQELRFVYVMTNGGAPHGLK